MHVVQRNIDGAGFIKSLARHMLNVTSMSYSGDAASHDIADDAV
jgi:hypothetical protein